MIRKKKTTKPAQVVAAQRRKKFDVVNYFGGKCQICGYSKYIGALHFHHVNNDGAKRPHPTYVVMRWSFDRAVEELKDCILICANCHSEIHSNDKSMDYERLVMPLSGVELICKQCGKVFSTKNKEQECCSYRCAQLLSRKVVRPDQETLKKEVEELGYCAVGRKYGVSDNAIRKWLK